MRLSPDSVLLTAAMRFQRRLNLNEVKQAIERLKHVIKVGCPSILPHYMESSVLKLAAHSAAHEVFLIKSWVLGRRSRRFQVRFCAARARLIRDAILIASPAIPYALPHRRIAYTRAKICFGNK